MSTQAAPHIEDNLSRDPRASQTALNQPLGDGEAPGSGICLLILSALWAVIFFTSLFAPPLFDDADATHANAARQILTSGDWVTLKVNGIRYLEKAPLPYWLDAISFRCFGFNAFAAHLPQAIAVLLLAMLGFIWAKRAYSRRAALYTGVSVLTSAGVFLFTRVFIPEVWLSLFLCSALYTFLRCLSANGLGAPSSVPLSLAMDGNSHEGANRLHVTYTYLMWASLAFAVLTKGLVALIFFFGTAIVYLALTGEYRRWRRLKPFTGVLLFLAIAAPWHILAGLRNTGGMNGHGFFWFYFINEHVLRFLGRRYPRDYNKLPGYLFWSLHLVWLFPWALFAPLTLVDAWKRRGNLFSEAGCRTTLLLVLFSAIVLGFFSFSTNQEYYTFPAYLPLLMLIAVALTRTENTYASDRRSRRLIILGQGLSANAPTWRGPTRHPRHPLRNVRLQAH